jgi:hypothetical protein
MGRMHVYQPCSFMTCWHARALWALVSAGVDGFVTRSAHRRGVQVYTNLLLEGPRMVTRACRRIDFAWTKSARATFAWQTRNSRVADFPGRYFLIPGWLLVRLEQAVPLASIPPFGWSFESEAALTGSVRWLTGSNRGSYQSKVPRSE